MVIKELKTEDEILNVIKIHWHADNDDYLSPMFHGTDTSMFSLMPQQREEVEEACDVIITNLVQLFKNNSIVSYDKRLVYSRDERGNSGDALVKAQGRKNNSPFYSYDYFCVTNHPVRAIDYSLKAWICGESGWVANRLLETANELNLVLPSDDQFNRSISLFNTRKQLQEDPIVLILVDVNSSGACFEDGTQIKIKTDANNHDIKISGVKSHANTYSIRLRKNILENMEKVYAVKESNYNELMRAWQEIQ